MVLKRIFIIIFVLWQAGICLASDSVKKQGLRVVKKYKKIHSQVYRNYRSDNLENDELPAPLVRAYYVLAGEYYREALKENSLKKMQYAKFFYTVTDFNDYQSDQSALYLEKIETFFQDQKLIQYEWTWKLKIDYLSWQERIKLKSDSSSSETYVLATNTAKCFGPELDYANGNWGVSIGSCLFIGNSQVDTEASSFLTHHDTTSSLQGLMASSFLYFKSSELRSHFGIAPFAISLTNSYPLPSGYTGEVATLNYGVALRGDLYFSESWALSTQIGNTFTYNMYGLSLIYQF